MTPNSTEEQIAILKEELSTEKEFSAGLLHIIKSLEYTIKKLKFQVGLEKTRGAFGSKFLSSVAGNLLMDPNPVEIKGQLGKAGSTETFMVSLLDILAVESNKRQKIIYLKEPATSKDSGLKASIIKHDNSFDKVLFKLQKGGVHLLQVHQSWAVNIYHYQLGDGSNFFLNNSLIKDGNTDLHKIPTDKIFDKTIYHNRLFEIKRLSDTQIGIALNLEKIEEINQILLDSEKERP